MRTSNHHTLLSIDRSHSQQEQEQTQSQSNRFKPIRDWSRRSRRTSLSFRLTALITALVTTTLAFSIWWIRLPSIHPLSSITTRTKSSSKNRSLFTLLIAPHPGRPIQINLDNLLNSISSQSAHLQLHSITLICSSSSSCPSTIPSQIQTLTNLNSFYPHSDSNAVLLIESELGLSELDPNWISNALDVLCIDLQTPRSNQIISATGLIRSHHHHHHLPTRLECKVGDAQTITSVDLPLTPILIKSKPWSRLTDYSQEDWLARSGLPSLRLSLDLFERQLPSFVMPMIDTSSIWKSCENGLGELRASAIGPGLEAQLIQHLDDTLYFDDEQSQSDQSGKGRLCLLLEELNQLEEGLGWDSIICNFLERGLHLDVLVMVDRLDERSEVKKRMKFLKCVIDIEIMTRTTTKTRIEAESRWHQFFISRNYSVLIFPKHSIDPIAKYVLEHKLGTDFGQFKDREDHDHQDERLVAIGLPSESVKGADWITGLELKALRNWYKPKIDISVITNDRPNSLTRLMDSLTHADYYGDEVNLILNLEQTSDLQTRKLCTNYQWNQGSKMIRQRIIHAGLLPAVIESWYPSSLNDSYGVLLEDDVEVSSQFYGWLKFSLLSYRYSSQTNQTQSLYGISLYQPQHIELKPEGRRPFNATELHIKLGVNPITLPYLSPIPCSWGALFFPETWIDFQTYLTLRLSDSLKPKLSLEGSAILTPIRSTRWPKSWKKYLIEWVYLNGKVMLYPNFWNFENHQTDSLSTNHLEKGTHIHESVEELIKKTFEVNLMKPKSSLINLIGLNRLPNLMNLMCIDLWGEICNLVELFQRGWIAIRDLGFCDEENVEEGNEGLIRLNQLICKT